MGIVFLIPIFCILLLYLFLKEVIEILIEFEVVKTFVDKIKIQAKNPQNIRDLSLGLFINAVYGLSTDVSFVNVLIAITCFYGIISSNDTIERNNKLKG